MGNAHTDGPTRTRRLALATALAMALALIAAVAVGVAPRPPRAAAAVDQQSWIPAATLPAERPAVTAYDSARQRIVLFGADRDANQIDRAATWEWDGNNWTRRTPPTSPPVRSNAGMAYDAARKRVVLFGGDGFGHWLGDTWEWDGNNWTQRTPATSPPARAEPGMTYDAVRQRIVLFGGRTGEGPYTPLGDTWEWDGATWTRRAPTTSPSARAGAAMAYDAVRQRTVLFGGTDDPNTRAPYANGVLADTWEWNGTIWTRRTPATSPSARTGAAMAYDAARQRIVIFGGAANPYPTYPYFADTLDDTWTWNGTTWIRLAPATSPTQRGNAAIAYDAARQRIVIFGGDAFYYEWSGDTWAWDGTTWSELRVLPPSGGTAIAYDAARQRVVLFGGDAYGNLESAQTWEWDGQHWTKRSPTTSPPARNHAAIAYDAVRRRIVLFGGATSPGQPLADTWEWDGNNWTRRTPTTSPPARTDATMAYDAIRQRIVLFGGDDTSHPHAPTADTWEWDGNNWIMRTPTTSPPSRAFAAMAYDAARQRVVLFGGRGPRRDVVELWSTLTDTWEWDGTTWAQRTPATSPPGDFGAAMVYDGTRGRIELFGGDGIGQPVSDAWEWDGSTWTTRATTSPRPNALAMTYDAARATTVLFTGRDTWVLPSVRRHAVMVVSTVGSAPDEKVFARLVSLGYSVSYMPESALNVADAANADLVVLSSSVHVDKIVAKLRNIAAPLLTFEGFLHDENGLSISRNGETSAGYKQVNIADVNSPLAAGLSGTITVASTATPLSVATPRGDADVVATVPGHADQAAIVAYRKGDRLSDGTPVPGPRVGFFFSYNTPTSTTAAGWSLFDAAVRWLGAAPVNDSPHPIAELIVSKAGLIPDQAVFDRLVTLGYTPKWMPETALDLAAAGKANVVVLSSSVHPEKIGTKFRNLAVPMLTYEGYLHRDNALSTTSTGETGAGSKQVSIANPASPLAAGLSGNVTVSTTAWPLSIATPGGDGQVVATVPGRADQAAISAYRTGDRLSNGTRAPAPRVGFFFSYNTPATATAAGWSLFDASVRWLNNNRPNAPSWKILALIYKGTDYSYTSGSVQHRLTNTMTSADLQAATDSVTAFVTQDIPRLDSGAMIPTVTVKVPQHPLTSLTPFGSAFWPAPPDTAPDRDPSYDAVIVIWDPWVKDTATGQISWVGGGDGLTLPVGTGQTYSWINLDGAIHRGHRNVFKHEFGHSITWFFDAAGTAPKPAVDNHASATTNTYVHCRSGAPYVWQDESLANPIPNSTYNNDSGFTHDYYSGTTARPATPNSCLGVPPEAWAASKPTSLNPPSAAARTPAPSNASPVP